MKKLGTFLMNQLRNAATGTWGIIQWFAVLIALGCAAFGVVYVVVKAAKYAYVVLKWFWFL